jgi:hypothetical protein
VQQPWPESAGLRGAFAGEPNKRKRNIKKHLTSVFDEIIVCSMRLCLQKCGIAVGDTAISSSTAGPVSTAAVTKALIEKLCRRNTYTEVKTSN